MKTLVILFALLLFSLSINGQTTSNADSSKANGVATNGSDGGGKAIVPSEKSAPVGIAKISVVPTIDGKVDEDAWKQAAVFKDFYQTYPGNNTQPSRPTEVYLMFDEKNLYVAFKCWDEKDKIRATVAKRDNVFGED
ncbi:MAG: hypothetical protein ABL952_08305, partial [Pyrinomonadaceae bacterium]